MIADLMQDVRVAGALAAAVLVWLGALGLARWAPVLGLVKLPDHRASHVVPTPHAGGLSMVAVLSGLWLWLQQPAVWLLPLLAMALVGFIDDRKPLPAKLRFGVQIVTVAGIAACVSPTGLEWMGVTVALLLGLWWVNLFNFMDGTDGLAASQALFMSVAALLLVHAGASGDATGMQVVPSAAGGAGLSATASLVLLACVAIVSLGFLPANRAPARIFMGDVGSQFLGLALLGGGLGAVLTGGLNWASALVLPAAFTADATVTLLRRMATGERWSEPHRSHAYQRLARKWAQGTDPALKKGHARVARALWALNIGWVLPLAWVAGQSDVLSGVACVLVAHGVLMLAAWRLGAGLADGV